MIELSPNYWHGDFNTFLYSTHLVYRAIPDSIKLQTISNYFSDNLITQLPSVVRDSGIDTITILSNIQFMDTCEVRLL